MRDVGDRRTSQVAVNEQDSPSVRFAQRQREIDGRQGLAVTGLRAGDHHDLEASIGLRVMQRRGEAPELFHEHGIGLSRDR